MIANALSRPGIPRMLAMEGRASRILQIGDTFYFESEPLPDLTGERLIGRLSWSTCYGPGQRRCLLRRADDERTAGRNRGLDRERDGECTMQEQGVGSMNLVGTAVPFLWAGSGDKRKGRQATDPVAASAPWINELAALKRAQQAHAQSMMMLVHELRAPAAASKSTVATIRYLHQQDTQLDSLLATVENRMDRLLDLVNDILDLSQAKAGRPLGQAAVLDLVAETWAVCEPHLEEAAAKGLEVGLELPASSLRARMADRAYQLIVSNLVSNAVKYTPAGSVRVTLRRKGDWAVLTVQDTGIGVPPGEIGHLCTEFFRASNARESHTPGTGLGLAAVQALVESHGGKLELRSQENKGSRFRVRLPLCKKDAAREIESPLRAERNVQ